MSYTIGSYGWVDVFSLGLFDLNSKLGAKHAIGFNWILKAIDMQISPKKTKKRTQFYIVYSSFHLNSLIPAANFWEQKASEMITSQ